MLKAWERTRVGRHLLQIPGPTNIPDRVRRAVCQPPIDHRSEAYRALTLEVTASLAEVFGPTGPIVLFSSSGTGACEAALTNALSPGDRLLMAETGHFADAWRQTAVRLGLEVVFLPGDWSHGVDPEAIEQTLVNDAKQSIKAVAVIHNETSTGVTSRLPAIRAAIDRAGHPALFLADSVSGLGAMELCQDAVRIDVAIASSQKGLMLPPGLGINALSSKALDASKHARLPKLSWDWHRILDTNAASILLGAPASSLLLGLRELLHMLIHEEGLPEVYARHARLAAATRCAVSAWGFANVCTDTREHSSAVTAVRMPEGHSADLLRRLILKHFDMSLGSGLGRLSDRVFRIAHLGALDESTLVAVLGGVEMGLALAHVPYRSSGVQAAMDQLAGSVPSRAVGCSLKSDPSPTLLGPNVNQDAGQAAYSFHRARRGHAPTCGH